MLSGQLKQIFPTIFVHMGGGWVGINFNDSKSCITGFLGSNGSAVILSAPKLTCAIYSFCQIKDIFIQVEGGKRQLYAKMMPT